MSRPSDAVSAAVPARRRRTIIHLLLAAVPLIVIGLVFSSASSDDVALGEEGSPSKYVAVTPFRRVDTRIDLGVDKVGDNTLRVKVAGRNGVPAGASAVVVTVVATGARSDGFVSAYPTGTKRPLASIINYGPGTYSTESIVPLGSDGSFDIYTLTDVDLVIDVTGAFVPANGSKDGRFVADTPQRILDTRRSRSMQAGETRSVGLPAAVPKGATAVIVTLTSTAPNRPGFFTAFASGNVPETSSLNVSSANSTRASTTIVPVTDGSFQVFSSHGGELVVDLLGHFTGSWAVWSNEGLYVPMTPTRQLDTRLSRPLGAGETRGFPAAGTGTAVGSMAMMMPSMLGYGAVFANGTEYTGTSSINLSDVPIIANMALSRSTDHGVALYSSTTADYLFDQYGYFTTGPARITTNVAPTVPTTVPAPVPPSGGGGGGGGGGAGCTVSSLLVPSCGAWLGSSVPDGNGGYDFMQGIAEYEAVAQNEPDIVHVYKTGGGGFPSRGDREVSERPGHQRAILLINWKPSGSHTWREIANGAADANIRSVAESIKRYPYKFFLTIWHEPENEVGRTGKSPADYVAMYRYVVQSLRSLGVTNAVYVWNMMGSTNHASMYDGLYPGHDVVDWIGYDPYAQEQTTSMSYLVNRPNDNIGWPGFYVWATRKAPGKPLMLSEWGFNLKVNDYGPAALRTGAAEMRDGFPMLKAFVYWNQTGGFTPRLGQDPDYDAAYRVFAADPYFNSTSTALAP